jgi:hypothetical protein
LFVKHSQAVEKVFLLSLRAKRGNLAFNEINGLEIASSQKLLLAMTCDEFLQQSIPGKTWRPLQTISAAVFVATGAQAEICGYKYVSVWYDMKQIL